jgi:hypothetical protein
MPELILSVLALASAQRQLEEQFLKPSLGVLLRVLLRRDEFGQIHLNSR